MLDERKTVGMLRGSKEELFAQGHPVIRQIKEIPGIVFPEDMEALPSSAVSLKQLFSRKQMDENHVDCLVLYRIAAGVLRILKALAEKGIHPGLIEIGDFFVDLLPGSVQVYLTHPEKFQLLHYEQDYEWYPEDERLFGDLELFDAEAQRKADVRLIYKILVASSKGNVKMPPKFTEADYSELFYKALPDEWKQLFARKPDCEYEIMDQLLAQCIEMEESFAKEARERLDDKAQKKLGEQMFTGKHETREGWQFGREAAVFHDRSSPDGTRRFQNHEPDALSAPGRAGDRNGACPLAMAAGICLWKRQHRGEGVFLLSAGISLSVRAGDQGLFRRRGTDDCRQSHGGNDETIRYE